MSVQAENKMVLQSWVAFFPPQSRDQARYGRGNELSQGTCVLVSALPRTAALGKAPQFPASVLSPKGRKFFGNWSLC